MENNESDCVYLGVYIYNLILLGLTIYQPSLFNIYYTLLSLCKTIYSGIREKWGQLLYQRIMQHFLGNARVFHS